MTDAELPAQWRAAVDAALRAKWGLGVVDAGIGDAELALHQLTGESPEAFADWWGTRYDLTPVREWGL